MHLRYMPGASALHQLHPLVKFGWLLFLSVLVFALRNPVAAVIILAAAISLFAAGRLPLRSVAGMRTALAASLFLAALQIFFVQDGEPLFHLWSRAVTTSGLSSGIRIGGRFLAIILLSYAFVLTTSPNDLSFAMMQAGIPYRYGFALVTALRLVPIFQQEAATVYKAQLARGFRYDQRNLNGIIDLPRRFLLPMLVSSLGRVDYLSVSMESRSFGMLPKRTYLRTIPFQRRDGFALAALIAATVAALAAPWITSMQS